ncbi:MAG: hypothetical protein E7534_06355 [Ruminococcaceae bacterium]|nr:hypothetical protein [Oscillospiraceae bacterium]
MAVVISTVLKILAAIVVFGIIILVHEFGHFIVARMMKVRVIEFAIGMGPRLLKWGKKDTTYSLRLFPLGGFCSMEGEDEGAPTPSALGGHADTDGEEALLPSEDTEEIAAQEPVILPPDTSRSFAHKKVWQRILIVIAGAFMNLLLGFILILCYNLFCTSGDYVLAHLSCTTTIATVGEEFDTPLKPGDTIVKMDGERLYSYMDFVTFLQTDEDGKFDVLVERPQADGTKSEQLLEDVDFYLTTDEETGLRYLDYEMQFYVYLPTAGTIVQQTAKQEFSILVYTVRSLKYMLQGKYGLNDLSGPVGTIDIIGDAVQNAVTEEDRSVGIGFLLFLVALLTINIGVVNILPLPALDGGRLLFLIWEGITRRPVPPKYEGIVHLVGMILLVLLSIVIAFSDVLKIFG